MTSVIKKLQLHELRDIIDEQLNHILHLERSQVELREVLLEVPDDHDFVCALSENEVTLKEKRSYVYALKQQLFLVDPAYFTERYGKLEKLQGSSTPSAPAPSRAIIAIESGISACSLESKVEDIDDAGVYL